MGGPAMMAAPANDLRGSARALPDVERTRRLETVYSASDARLLRAVVATGIGGGEWRSSADFAERALVITPRRLRRMLEDDGVVLTEPVRTKLERLAFAFGVEVV